MDDWDIGKINVPLAWGEITPTKICGTIGEIMAGKKLGNTDPREITVFDVTGMAIRALALGLAIYRRAEEMGLGVYRDFLR